MIETSGVRRSWEMELSSARCSFSVACEHLRLAGLFGQLGPLDGQGRLAGKRLQQPTLFRRQVGARDRRV